MKGRIELLASPLLHARLAGAALAAARARTWEHALARLAAGYRLALEGHGKERPHGAQSEVRDRAA